MLIKILEEQSHKKGELFEKFSKNLLENLGYDKINLRTIKAGYEIDIEAQDASETPYIVECKAHKRPLNSGALKEFFAKFYLLKRESPHASAAIFTLSGLNRGARLFLDELKKDEHLRFNVYEPDYITGVLEKKGLLTSKEKVQNKISALLKRLHPFLP